MWRAIVGAFLFVLFGAVVALPASAEPKTGDGIIEPGENETDELARAVQNPVASMISLPFQNSTNFNFGPLEKPRTC